jgi:hypothetical protein
MEILAFLATMAIYAQWKFASPFLPNPTLKGDSILKRQMPLVLFLISGILLSIAIANFEGKPFIISLFLGLGLIFLALWLAYRSDRS